MRKTPFYMYFYVLAVTLIVGWVVLSFVTLTSSRDFGLFAVFEAVVFFVGVLVVDRWVNKTR